MNDSSVQIEREIVMYIMECSRAEPAGSLSLLHAFVFTLATYTYTFSFDAFFKQFFFASLSAGRHA